MSTRIDLLKLLTSDLGLHGDEYAGKTVVITGAGRGIGLQAARAFALLGGNAVIEQLKAGLAKDGSSGREGTW